MLSNVPPMQYVKQSRPMELFFCFICWLRLLQSVVRRTESLITCFRRAIIPDELHHYASHA